MPRMSWMAPGKLSITSSFSRSKTDRSRIPLAVSILIGPREIGKNLIFILSSSLSHSLKCEGPFTSRLGLPRGKKRGASMLTTLGCAARVLETISSSVWRISVRQAMERSMTQNPVSLRSLPARSKPTTRNVLARVYVMLHMRAFIGGLGHVLP